jgi:Tol biopolymer transport system component
MSCKCITGLLLSLLLAATWAQAETVSEQALLSKVRQLTFEGKRAGEGYFNAAGTRMIFQSERDAANPFYQIFLMDLETGDVEQLSPGHGKTTCAWLHPSDRYALYASTHHDPEARSKMQAELDFRASGKQRRYSWDYDHNFDIFAHDLASGDRRNLTNTKGYDAEGAYSPDGKRVVFASNRRAYSGEMTPAESRIFEHDKSYMMDIYIMDADGANLKRLTDSPGYDGGPFFSADGSKITWRRFSEDGSRAEIFTMDLASGEEKQLTRMGVMSWAPYFHPSGEYLIFASNREGFANFELFLVDAGGKREPVRVTHTDGFDGLPVFSPDGSRLSWTTTRSADKNSQIFMAQWNHARAMAALGLNQKGAATTGQVAADISTTGNAIDVADIRLHVSRLASEEMEGRLTGTRGEQIATGYVASVFRQLGLEPGNNGDFFQPFNFTAGVRLGADNSLQLSSRAGLKLDSDWRPLALSRTGSIEPAEVVFAGYGMVAPGTDKVPDYDSYGDLDVAGKWVMLLRFQPESVPAEWRRHMAHYSDLPYKAAVAKRRGAAGMIVVTGPRAQARDRLVELRFDASSQSSIAAVALSDEVATSVLSGAGQSLDAIQEKLDQGETLAGFSLDGVRVSGAIDIVREQRTGRNVVARLGSGADSGQPPVILGAHVDHLGRGEVSGSLAREDERNAVHFGADDNASGVAAMLESAQYLTGLKARGKLGAKRDIYFIAWSGEELGTLGSTHYTGQMAAGGDLKGKVAAYLNMDMIGHLREKAYLQGTGSSPVWSREIERRNVPVGLPIATKQDPYLPTDATPFYMQGVPILSAFTGAHENYSSPRDTAESLNYEGIRDIARLMSGITRALARSEAIPEYRQVERKQSGIGRKHLRAYLGTIPSYGQDESVKGVRLQGAVKGAPAEAAGIRNGDILVGLGEVRVETIHDFMSALAGLKAGEPTGMVVLRKGKRLELTVVPGARE